jgi:tRNA A-37 threonylcarbamoyl transferase component Bud32
MIGHWKKAGFKVPDIYDKQVQGVAKPYLVTSFIDGMTLQDYLLKDNEVIDKKIKTLSKLFRILSQRHDYAIRTDNRYLIHYDPSSDNILYTENGFYFIDFETILPKRCSVLESASIELAITCRWIVRDLGIELIEEVLKLMVLPYTKQESLLRYIINRTLNRPFQFYHRRKNRHRKLEFPQDVTKYDIADALSKLL